MRQANSSFLLATAVLLVVLNAFYIIRLGNTTVADNKFDLNSAIKI